MNPESYDENFDRLWKEYRQLFDGYDDLTLVRWMSQTLGQLHGRVCRLSHPIIGAYRVASSIALDRDIWSQRLTGLPAGYVESSCCRAPILPLFSRDIYRDGLICEQCSEVAIAFDDLPSPMQSEAKEWAEKYDNYHRVAHWSEAKRGEFEDCDAELEKSVQQCRKMLTYAAREMLPNYLEYYPTILWEDQDECLGIKPDDVIADS